MLAIHANSLNKSKQNLQTKFNVTLTKLHDENFPNEEIYTFISCIYDLMVSPSQTTALNARMISQ
jgi:hypothetical protein